MTRRRWGLVAALVALVVIVVVGLLVWQATSRPASAEEAATAYLHALESGDPDTVAATGVSVSSTALGAFSTAAELIVDAEVTSVVENGDEETSVDVSFRLAGEERTAVLLLALDDGVWMLDSSAVGSMTPTSSIGSYVGVGEETVPVEEAVSLLPASYVVTVEPSSLLDGESAVHIVPGESVEVAVEAALRPEATDAAQDKLAAHLDVCTAPAEAAPDGCGIRIPWGTEFRDVTGIRYRIEQVPVITVTTTAFAADRGVLVATVTGTGQDGALRTTTYRTDSWSLRGDVRFTADDLALTVW